MDSDVVKQRPEPQTRLTVARNYLADGMVDALSRQILVLSPPHATPNPPTNQIPSSIFSALSVKFVMVSLCELQLIPC